MNKKQIFENLLGNSQRNPDNSNSRANISKLRKILISEYQYPEENIGYIRLYIKEERGFRHARIRTLNGIQNYDSHYALLLKEGNKVYIIDPYTRKGLFFSLKAYSHSIKMRLDTMAILMGEDKKPMHKPGSYIWQF